MDILKILQSDADKLLDSDLVMFEEELIAGGADAAYRKTCQDLISEERRRRKQLKEQASAAVKGESGLQAVLPSGVSASVLASADNLSPFNKVEVRAKSPFEVVSADVAAIRRSEKSKSLFREYLKKQPMLNEELVDAHFSFFDEWEIGAITDEIRFSEAFLEKYLASLDLSKVARKQRFSEDFFMKHFNEFDPALVLNKGKNEWKAKNKRSKKLDTFLRLKGVRI